MYLNIHSGGASTYNALVGCSYCPGQIVHLPLTAGLFKTASVQAKPECTSLKRQTSILT